MWPVAVGPLSRKNFNEMFKGRRMLYVHEYDISDHDKTLNSCKGGNGLLGRQWYTSKMS